MIIKAYSITAFKLKYCISEGWSRQLHEKTGQADQMGAMGLVL